MAKGTKYAQKTIKKECFENMCACHCTEEEILLFIGVSRTTLSRWCKTTYGETFEQAFKRLRVGCNYSLRRKQYEVAMGGNTTMLVWLGKQYLNQMEQVQDSTPTDETNIEKSTLSEIRKHGLNDEDCEVQQEDIES